MADRRREKRPCEWCGGEHWGFEMRKCAARADRTNAVLEHDAPGVRRFGDRLNSWTRTGETLTLASPHPRPPTVHVPDEWNEEAR